MSAENSYSIRVKRENDLEFVFDLIRKKWLRLTPEEKVRQLYIKYLVEVKKYPLGWIQVEYGFGVNGQAKRADIVIYKNSQAFAVVECKAPSVPLTQLVADQANEYQLSLGVSHIVLTNGRQALVFAQTSNSEDWQQLAELPKCSSE
ncbi:MAG: hypothetical protein RIS47_812 [Bacteroidota bacterium]